MKIPSVPKASRLMDWCTSKTPGQAAIYVNSRLTEVVKGFPNFDTLDPFTKEMTAELIDRDECKRALARLHGCQKTLARFAHLPKREFLGRLKSLLKKLEKPLEILHHASLVLRRIPDPTDGFTLCLAGFPNAGKSTLIKKLTGAKVEIAAYEFTTKSLNYGTMEIHFHPVQVVDTPGTLNRIKSNTIEKQALLALKHLAQAIVFVYDPMRPADEQEKLFETLFAYKVPLAIYASKQDIIADIPAFRKASELPVFTKSEEIVSWLRPLVKAKLKAV